jgi:hypothetical protein
MIAKGRALPLSLNTLDDLFPCGGKITTFTNSSVTLHKPYCLLETPSHLGGITSKRNKNVAMA